MLKAVVTVHDLKTKSLNLYTEHFFIFTIFFLKNCRAGTPKEHEHINRKNNNINLVKLLYRCCCRAVDKLTPQLVKCIVSSLELSQYNLEIIIPREHIE